MALALSEVRAIVQRVCTRPDVLAACRQHDIGYVVEALGTHKPKVTQGQIAALTGISQGRLSEYMRHKRTPEKAAIFRDFADGLDMPAVAREALGLDPAGSATAGRSLIPAMREPPDDTGLAYPDTPDDAAENVIQLWQADLADGTELARGRIDPGRWNDASLRWLVDPASLPAEPANGVHIGMSDIARFRATVELFQQLDDRYGGGHARQALIQYLRVDAERLLRGKYAEVVGRALFSSVAEATLLGAWMTYDAAPASRLTQKYFIQALRLAQAGNDRLLGASILDAMSHQATYTGRFREAANLARAARTGTCGVATATLTSHFHTMEARALARLGDAKACDHALAEAAREFERRNPEADPQWIRYFNEAELAAEFGHCLRDLGRATDAAQYASSCIGTINNDVFARSDFFATMVLADAYLTARELEQACRVALKALTGGEQIRSARCVRYLREFRQHLEHIGSATAVIDFQEQARGSRLWRIASRPDKCED
jgi:transcriptional regulator with XRE-family HTH domain